MNVKQTAEENKINDMIRATGNHNVYMFGDENIDVMNDFLNAWENAEEEELDSILEEYSILIV